MAINPYRGASSGLQCAGVFEPSPHLLREGHRSDGVGGGKGMCLDLKKLNNMFVQTCDHVGIT